MRAAEECPLLSDALLSCLHQRGVFVIGQIFSWQGEFPLWSTTDQLGLPASVEFEWDEYCNFFRGLGLIKHIQGHKLRWGSKTLRDQIVVKDLYQSMMKDREENRSPCWIRDLWRVRVPKKKKKFSSSGWFGGIRN